MLTGRFRMRNKMMEKVRGGKDMKIRVKSLEETEKIGGKLGRLVEAGDIITLDGDLGAGKTAITKSIALGLGIEEHITSPTFTIVNEYDGKYPLYHFDVYRIGDPEEIYDIGYEEYINSSGVCIIEWSRLIAEVLPRQRLEVIILRCDGDNEREIELIPHGERYEKMVEELIG